MRSLQLVLINMRSLQLILINMRSLQLILINMRSLQLILINMRPLQLIQIKGKCLTYNALVNRACNPCQELPQGRTHHLDGTNWTTRRQSSQR